MKINNIKNLGFIKGMLKEGEAKTIDFFLPILKRFLDYLNISWADECCNTIGANGNPPVSFNVEDEELQYYNPVDNTLTAVPLGGGGAEPLVYRALLSQVGTDAPTAIVLENTIGNIVWTRVVQGQYMGTLTGAFTVNKTWQEISPDSALLLVSISRGDADNIIVETGDASTATLEDGYIDRISLLILVYP